MLNVLPGTAQMSRREQKPSDVCERQKVETEVSSEVSFLVYNPTTKAQESWQTHKHRLKLLFDSCWALICAVLLATFEVKTSASPFHPFTLTTKQTQSPAESYLAESALLHIDVCTQTCRHPCSNMQTAALYYHDLL